MPLKDERLSLSNTYDMNRGITEVHQSGKIIEEYFDNVYVAESRHVDFEIAGLEWVASIEILL